MAMNLSYAVLAKTMQLLSPIHPCLTAESGLSVGFIWAHTQPFYGSVEFVRDNPGEPVPEETFTHYKHRGHQSSLSAFSIYYDTWHPPYSIRVLYSLFQNLSPSFLWSTSWPGTLHFILHTFLHPIIVFFSQHMPTPSQPIPL